jgi:hypothetical protein
LIRVLQEAVRSFAIGLAPGVSTEVRLLDGKSFAGEMAELFTRIAGAPRRPRTSCSEISPLSLCAGRLDAGRAASEARPEAGQR